MQSDRFRAAAESKDFSAIDELFAEEVRFKSPVVFKPYEGRDAVAMILGAVVQVFEDFRYTDQVETGETATLAFSARVGDRELDGIDLLRFDPDGRVRELAVYVRPISGVNALAEAMKAKLEEAAT
jgi:SnoaL-like domain